MAKTPQESEVLDELVRAAADCPEESKRTLRHGLESFANYVGLFRTVCRGPGSSLRALSDELLDRPQQPEVVCMRGFRYLCTAAADGLQTQILRETKPNNFYY